MTTEFNNIKIIETANTGFNESEVDYLTELFITTVERMVPTLARESWFKLGDFADSEAHAVDQFMLLIVRKTIHHQEQWRGIFQGDKKRLKIVAIIKSNTQL